MDNAEVPIPTEEEASAEKGPPAQEKAIKAINDGLSIYEADIPEASQTPSQKAEINEVKRKLEDLANGGDGTETVELKDESGKVIKTQKEGIPVYELVEHLNEKYKSLPKTSPQAKELRDIIRTLTQRKVTRDYLDLPYRWIPRYYQARVREEIARIKTDGRTTGDDLKDEQLAKEAIARRREFFVPPPETTPPPITPPTTTPTPISEGDPRFTISFVDASDDANKIARESSGEFVREQLHVKNKWSPREWMRAIKFRWGEDYYKITNAQKVQEDQVRLGQYFCEQDSVNGAVREVNNGRELFKKQMSSTAQRFSLAGEGKAQFYSQEEHENLADTEISSQINNLITRYAKGELSSEQFETERQGVVELLKNNPDVAPYIKESNFIASDILEVAQKVKLSHERGQIALENLDRMLNIQIGRAIMASTTEADYTRLERTMNWLQGGKFRGLAANPLFIGVAFGVAGAGAKGILGMGARAATGFPIVGGGIATAFAGLRRWTDLKRDFELNERDDSYSRKANPDKAPRRAKLAEFRYNIAEGGGRVTAQGLLDRLTSLSNTENPTDTQIDEILTSVAEIDARINYGIENKMDLMAYANRYGTESEKLKLVLQKDVALEKIKAIRKAQGRNDDEIKSEIDTQINTKTGEFWSKFSETKDKQNTRFNRYRFGESLKAAGIAAVTATLGGLATQEILALGGRAIGIGINKTVIEGALGINPDTGTRFGGLNLTDVANKAGSFEVNNPVTNQKLELVSQAFTDPSDVDRKIDFVTPDKKVVPGPAMWLTPDKGNFVMAGGKDYLPPAVKDMFGNYEFNVTSNHNLREYMRNLVNGDIKKTPDEVLSYGNFLLNTHDIKQSNFINPEGLPYDEWAAKVGRINPATGLVEEGKMSITHPSSEVQLHGFLRGDGSFDVNKDFFVNDQYTGNRDITPDQFNNVISNLKVEGWGVEDSATGYHITPPEAFELTAPLEEAPIIPIPFAPRHPLEKMKGPVTPPPYEYFGYPPEYGLGYPDRGENSVQNYMDWLKRVGYYPKEIPYVKNADGKWVNADGSEIKRDPDREKENIREYLENQTAEHSEKVQNLVRQLKPMEAECRVAVTIPAFIEGKNIYHTLSEWANQRDDKGNLVDKSLYEIDIINNGPTGYKKDNTLEEIARFQKDNPGMRINVIDVEIPQEGGNVGMARKIIVDTTLQRSINRPSQSGPLYIESEDADLMEIDRKAVFNVIKKFDDQPYLDALRGKQDLTPQILMQNDLLFFDRRAERFMEYLLRDARLKPEVNENYDFYWNRLITGGWNTAFTAESYALIGGYQPARVGEDVEIGRRLSVMRGSTNADAEFIPNVNVIGRVSNTGQSNPRRFINALAKKIPTYADFTDEQTNREIRELSLDDSMKKLDHGKRIGPDNIKEFEDIVSRTRQFISWKVPDPKMQEILFGRLMTSLGFKKYKTVTEPNGSQRVINGPLNQAGPDKDEWKLDYNVEPDGKVKIDNIGNIQAALESYRLKAGAAPTPSRPVTPSPRPRPTIPPSTPSAPATPETLEAGVRISPERSTTVEGIGFSEDIGPRPTMEDAHYIRENFRGIPNETFLGIYDGHGGREVAAELPRTLSSSFASVLDLHPELSEVEAFKMAYADTNNLILSLPAGRNAGSTAVNAYIKGNKLFVANAGDARAVLSRGNQAVRLSHDHKATDPEERARIERAGGRVDAQGYQIVGNEGLAVARAFGDATFRATVTSEPFVSETTLGPDDRFLIMACDGLWDVITDQEAADLIKNDQDPQRASEILKNEALRRGTQDNLSVLVVKLKPPEPPRATETVESTTTARPAIRVERPEPITQTDLEETKSWANITQIGHSRLETARRRGIEEQELRDITSRVRLEQRIINERYQSPPPLSNPGQRGVDWELQSNPGILTCQFASAGNILRALNVYDPNQHSERDFINILGGQTYAEGHRGGASQSDMKWALENSVPEIESRYSNSVNEILQAVQNGAGVIVPLGPGHVGAIIPGNRVTKDAAGNLQVQVLDPLSGPNQGPRLIPIDDLIKSDISVPVYPGGSPAIIIERKPEEDLGARIRLAPTPPPPPAPPAPIPATRAAPVETVESTAPIRGIRRGVLSQEVVQRFDNEEREILARYSGDLPALSAVEEFVRQTNPYDMNTCWLASADNALRSVMGESYDPNKHGELALLNSIGGESYANANKRGTNVNQTLRAIRSNAPELSVRRTNSVNEILQAVDRGAAVVLPLTAPRNAGEIGHVGAIQPGQRVRKGAAGELEVQVIDPMLNNPKFVPVRSLIRDTGVVSAGDPDFYLGLIIEKPRVRMPSTRPATPSPTPPSIPEPAPVEEVTEELPVVTPVPPVEPAAAAPTPPEQPLGENRISELTDEDLQERWDAQWNIINSALATEDDKDLARAKIRELGPEMDKRHLQANPEPPSAPYNPPPINIDVENPATEALKEAVEAPQEEAVPLPTFLTEPPEDQAPPARPPVPPPPPPAPPAPEAPPSTQDMSLPELEAALREANLTASNYTEPEGDRQTAAIRAQELTNEIARKREEPAVEPRPTADEVLGQISEARLIDELSELANQYLNPQASREEQEEIIERYHAVEATLQRLRASESATEPPVADTLEATQQIPPQPQTRRGPNLGGLVNRARQAVSNIRPTRPAPQPDIDMRTRPPENYVLPQPATTETLLVKAPSEMRDDEIREELNRSGNTYISGQATPEEMRELERRGAELDDELKRRLSEAPPAENVLPPLPPEELEDRQNRFDTYVQRYVMDNPGVSEEDARNKVIEVLSQVKEQNGGRIS